MSLAQHKEKQVGLSRATLEFSFEFSFWSDQSLVGILTNLHTYTFADLDTSIIAYLQSCIVKYLHPCILAYFYFIQLKLNQIQKFGVVLDKKYWWNLKKFQETLQKPSIHVPYNFSRDLPNAFPPDAFQPTSGHLLNMFHTPSKHVPNTFHTTSKDLQTPSKHLPDIFPTPSRYNQNTFQTPSGHLDTFQRPSKHLPDTFQAPSRHLPGILLT